MTSLELVATDVASDVDYAVLCGTCLDSLGEHYAAFRVVYESGAYLDGELAPEPLYTCDDGFMETAREAAARSTSFAPPTFELLPPVCKYCGASEFGCVTDSRGLCVKGSVAV